MSLDPSNAGARPSAGAHPLAGLITAAAAGRFPDPDGGWRRVPPWRPGLEAVLSFTGHAVFAVAPDITDHRLAALGADGFGGAHDPRLITALAGPEGWIDCLDMLMAARGTGQAGVPPRLAERPDLAAHSRAAFAATIRDHPRVLGYPDPGRSALAIVSRGIAGLTEVSFELEPGRRGRGGGSRLAADALTWSRPASSPSPPSRPATRPASGPCCRPGSCPSAPSSSSAVPPDTVAGPAARARPGRRAAVHPYGYHGGQRGHQGPTAGGARDARRRPSGPDPPASPR